MIHKETCAQPCKLPSCLDASLHNYPRRAQDRACGPRGGSRVDALVYRSPYSCLQHTEALLYPFSSHDPRPNPSFWFCGLPALPAQLSPPTVPDWHRRLGGPNRHLEHGRGGGGASLARLSRNRVPGWEREQAGSLRKQTDEQRKDKGIP